MASVEKQLLGTETTRAFLRKGVESVICGISANGLNIPCGISANGLNIPLKSAGANAFIMKPFYSAFFMAKKSVE